MTASRPQRYPGASTEAWWQGVWDGAAMDVNTLVLHTTEGTALPDYDGGADAPTLTALPVMAGRRLAWFQHFDIDVSSRALVNSPGGVETNTLNCAQVELGGTCDYAHRETWGSMRAGVDYVYWPQAPDWALDEVARFVAWLHVQHGVPLVAPPVWLAYGPDPRRPGVLPASYGPSPARMTPAQWTAFRGVLGHSHVPEQAHGDPGAFPITALLALASTYLPEDGMTQVDLTPASIGALVRATWDHKENSPTAEPGTDAGRRVGDLLRFDDKRYADLHAQGEAVLAAVKAISLTLDDNQLQALGAQVGAAIIADPVLVEPFAELVAEKLAARLQN